MKKVPGISFMDKKGNAAGDSSVAREERVGVKARHRRVATRAA